MDIDPSETPSWLFNYDLMDAVSVAVDFPPSPANAAATIDFSWGSQSINCCSNAMTEIDCSVENSGCFKEGSRKRLKSESWAASGMKACREKIRRDRLNERFLELGSVLEPGKPPKSDKVAVLSDAVRMLIQLRTESQKLKESNEELQEKIKELKAEKNELRDEKLKLKADKEKLEQQVKLLTVQPGFLSPPSAFAAGFAAQGQAANSKLIPFIGYPGVAMWQFMQPTIIDTSQDHVLRPPVA